MGQRLVTVPVGTVVPLRLDTPLSSEFLPRGDPLLQQFFGRCWLTVEQSCQRVQRSKGTSPGLRREDAAEDPQQLPSHSTGYLSPKAIRFL
jgi:hypothetical protein